MRIGEAALRKTRSPGANASFEEQARGEQEARRLVAEYMAIAGLGDEDLKKLPGSESRKMAAARVAADDGRQCHGWSNICICAAGAAATKRHLKRKDAKTQRSQRTEAEGDDSADFEDFAAFVPKDGRSKQIEGVRSRI